MDFTDFEQQAKKRMSEHFGTAFEAGRVGLVPKEFDFVGKDAANRLIVGDAKYYTLVRGSRVPPAKFSNIAEHVWLLEKTCADVAFLVFGNDRRVPDMWLERHRTLVNGVLFFFIDDHGALIDL